MCGASEAEGRGEGSGGGGRHDGFLYAGGGGWDGEVVGLGGKRGGEGRGGEGGEGVPVGLASYNGMMFIVLREKRRDLDRGGEEKGGCLSGYGTYRPTHLPTYLLDREIHIQLSCTNYTPRLETCMLINAPYATTYMPFSLLRESKYVQISE